MLRAESLLNQTSMTCQTMNRQSPLMNSVTRFPPSKCHKKTASPKTGAEFHGAVYENENNADSLPTPLDIFSRGEIKKRLAEDCRRKSDICGSGISRAPLRDSGRHNRRSNSV
ncbi:hypothetical protein HPB50_009442 [Hyalomma asiaticum]|uniref:Uncharacterized protein n=1 Tax=Hyalomma asiaticum TaxID=266040 RepID=A0ACB7SPP7_HYAAI|nr:hypothetical protein HPB50_009442 [Hyalomma asiaticum]